MDPVTKIYNIQTIGFEQVMSELDAISKKFTEVKKAKQDALKGAADTKRQQGEESQSYKDAAKALDELKIKEIELRAEKVKLTNEAKSAQNVRQEEINRQKESIAGNKAEVNSIAAIRKERAELNAAVIKVAPGSNVEFRGNTLQYDEAIAKLKQLSAVEQDFRRQFQKDATLVGEYTSGIIQAFKKLGIDDLVTGQVTKANDKLQSLNKEFEVLKAELISVRQSGAGILENLEKQLIENRNAAGQLEKEVGRLKTELRGAGDIGDQITTGLSNGFKSMKGQLSQFLLSYVGFQAAFQAITSGIDTARELSDQTTNLEIELGKSAGGANELVNALAKLNTRTRLTDLEQIANIAAKAGVSEKNLLGVTEALDKIKIAFGNDFGNVEEGTESLVKLINVFEGTDAVTGENLLKAGNAVRTLANETVASVPFLNDFSRRMAGLKGISNIALPAVLGLASGFEQFGQSSEVAGTALTKIIPKLATDTAKYAEVAGLTQQAFRDLLKDNPAEALIKVSEGLVKGKAGIEEISNAFADSELGTGRIAAILGTVGSKADDFRKAIASAGAAYQDTGNIEEAFAAKNENLASTLDKISKSFADAANSTGFRIAITAIAGIISVIIGNLGILTGVLGLYAAEWAVANAEMVKNRVISLATVVSDTLIAASKALATLATTSYNTAVTFLNTTLLRAAISTGILRLATSGLAIPLGIIIGIISLLAISITAFGNSVSKSVGQLKDFARQQLISAEITKKANDQFAEQTAVMSGLVSAIKAVGTSQDTQRAILQKLIDLNPAFRDALNGQVIDLQKLDGIYKQVTESIRAKAEAEASASLTAEKQKDVLSITTIRQKLETETARQTKSLKVISDLTDKEIDAIFDNIDLRTTSIRKRGNGAIEFQGEDFKRIQGNLKRQEDAAIGVFNDYVTAQAKTQKKLAEIENKAKEGQAANAKEVAKGFEVDVVNLNAQIKELDDQINVFQGAQKDLDILLKKREGLQAKLDAAMEKTRKAATQKASTLNGPEKDLIAQEDIKRDLLLTLEKKKRVLEQEDEETYLRNVLIINQRSIDNKIDLIRGKGIAEQKVRAQLSLERITLEQETVQKIQEIYNKEFTEKQAQLRNQLDEDIRKIKEIDNAVQVDPVATNTEKAQSKLDADNAILKLYDQFNFNVDILEKKLNQNTLKNSREIIKDINALQKDKLAAQRELTEAELKDVQATGNRLVEEFKATIAAARLSIAKNPKLTPQKRDEANAELDRQENIGILARENASNKSQLPIYKKLFEEKKKTDEEYYAFLKQMRDTEAKLIDGTTKDLQINVIKVTDISSFISKKVRSIFSFDTVNSGDSEATKNKKIALQEQFAAVMTETFNLAKTAMDDFYNAEAQQIERSRGIAEKRLQLEFDQRKSKAQSQAEQESLDKQFQARKEANDRDAFEKNKKIQIAQAKINLAMQLSNLAVIAFGPTPLNIATLGVAGGIMYAIQAALAVATYGMNVGRINSAQFEQGGIVPKRGGEIKGRSHAQGGVKFNYDYEAEGKELAIIRTKNANRNKIYQLTGTHTEIASKLNVLGGGIEFKPGAKLKMFAGGGMLGGNLQAPVFTPASQTNVYNNNAELVQKLDQLRIEMNQYSNETSKRIDRIKVGVNVNEITGTQKKVEVQRRVGTL